MYISIGLPGYEGVNKSLGALSGFPRGSYGCILLRRVEQVPFLGGWDLEGYIAIG